MTLLFRFQITPLALPRNGSNFFIQEKKKKKRSTKGKVTKAETRNEDGIPTLTMEILLILGAPVLFFLLGASPPSTFHLPPSINGIQIPRAPLPPHPWGGGANFPFSYLLPEPIFAEHAQPRLFLKGIPLCPSSGQTERKERKNEKSRVAHQTTQTNISSLTSQ